MSYLSRKFLNFLRSRTTGTRAFEFQNMDYINVWDRAADTSNFHFHNQHVTTVEIVSHTSPPPTVLVTNKES